MMLITGSGGMIGRALTAALRQNGIPVAAAHRQDADWIVNLEDIPNMRIPDNVSLAILCGWSGGVAEARENPSKSREMNVAGHEELVRRLRAKGARIIFLSTSLVFSGPDTSPSAPLSPCCEYGRQKSDVEQLIHPGRDAIVRVTKVGETLLPRLRLWREKLDAGSAIAVSSRLRLAPLMLNEVVKGLVWLAAEFRPGIYQMSASADQSYQELGLCLATRLGVDHGMVVPDESVPLQMYDTFPVLASLTMHAPEGCPVWPSGNDCTQQLVEIAASRATSQ